MLINVILGGETYYSNGVPCVRGGTPSRMDTAALEKREHHIDNDVETTTATEYWLDGQLVHRSVNMRLKTGIFAEGALTDFF